MARFVHACRMLESKTSRKLTAKPTLAERGSVLRTIAVRFDGLPVRGVDEGAVTYTLGLAERYLQLANQITAGQATQADLDTLKAEWRLRGNRVSKALEAR
ncbi:MAG: hypothetical protein SNJ75_14945 [Gemmataceae bacterium]